MFSAALKSCFRLGLGAIPTRVYQRLFPRDVIGLCYHMVTDEYPRHVAHISPYKKSAQFEADLKYLTEHYEVISYEELCERRAESGEPRGDGRGTPSPRNSRHSTLGFRPSIVVTFDDGYRECFEVVRPLLLKYEVPAIFFVTTAFIDNQQLFFRNKVSLCIDRVLGLSKVQWPEVVKRLHQHEIIDETADSHATPDTRHLTPSAFIRWLENLTHDDEPTIDDICRILGLDTHRFLREHQPYLTTPQIQHLTQEGFTIGAHGVTHARLGDLLGEEPRAESVEQGVSLNTDRCSLTTESQTPETRQMTRFESEIVESCRRIGQITGSNSVPFAFPFGASNVPLELIQNAYRENQEVGLIFDSRAVLLGPPYLVQRISSDHSEWVTDRSSNVPRLIHRAYQSQLRRTWIEPLKRKLPVVGCQLSDV